MATERTRIALQVLSLNELHPAVLWLEEDPAAVREPESLRGGIRIMFWRIRESKPKIVASER